jgi:hypothetical protein
MKGTIVRFKVVTSGKDSLVVSYESPRGPVDLAIGLARGMGDYYGEKVSIAKLSPLQFRIDF